MDKFLEQKKKENESKSETQYFLSQNTKKQIIQTYNEEYLKLGFIECLSDISKLKGLVNYKTLSNEDMKPAKLMQHLMTHHPELTGKPPTFFEKEKKII